MDFSPIPGCPVEDINLCMKWNSFSWHFISAGYDLEQTIFSLFWALRLSFRRLNHLWSWMNEYAVDLYTIIYENDFLCLVTETVVFCDKTGDEGGTACEFHTDSNHGVNFFLRWSLSQGTILSSKLIFLEWWMVSGAAWGIHALGFAIFLLSPCTASWNN